MFQSHQHEGPCDSKSDKSEPEDITPVKNESRGSV